MQPNTASAAPPRSLLARLPLAAARVGVGALFLLAGLLKVLIFPTFSESTALFLGIPAALGPVAAAAVLAVEAGVGAALLARRRVRLAATVAAGMLVLFVLVLARAEWTGLEASCNCFGTTSVNLSYRAQIVVDMVLLALVLWVRREHRGRRE